MKRLTPKQARLLKPGTRIALHEFDASHPSNLPDWLITRICPKQMAKEVWQDQYRERDVWYVFKKERRRYCYSMIANNGRKFCWKEVFLLESKEDEERLKLLLEV